jgi:hypothetical protein
MYAYRVNFDPLLIIFARQRMKADLIDGALSGTNFASNMGRRMKLEVCVKGFDIF